MLSRLFDNSKANTHYVYTHGHIKDNEVLEFVEKFRGSCGIYQNLMVMMSGDTREQLYWPFRFFGKLVEDVTMVKTTYEEFYRKLTKIDN